MGYLKPVKEKFSVKLLKAAKQLLDSVEEKARDKIVFNRKKVKLSNDNERLKKLNDEIWEFQTLLNLHAARNFVAKLKRSADGGTAATFNVAQNKTGKWTGHWHYWQTITKSTKILLLNIN